MERNRIKWVIFDAMGVIYTKGDDVLSWVVPFIKEKNADADLSHVKDVYHRAVVGEMTSSEFFEYFGVENSATAMYEYTKKYPELDENFKDAAEELIEKDYHIAMLSNDLDEWSRLLRRRFNLNLYIEKAIISGEEKIAKPDRDIYIRTIGKLDAMPEECVFIDDKEQNLIAARNLGFHVLRFNRNNEKFISNIDTIDSFLQLNEYIDDLEDRLSDVRR